jgi:hypothetical protein
MKRRDLLKAGATGALGAAAKPATAEAASVFDPSAVEARLDRIDRRMAWFSQTNMTPRAPRTPIETKLFAERSHLARMAFRSFYFTGAFLDLSEADQMHPGVQARIARMQPEMDAAVNGAADLMENLKDRRGGWIRLGTAARHAVCVRRPHPKAPRTKPLAAD